MARAFGEMLFDLAPDKGAVEQHVGAVRGMNRRAVRHQRLFRIDHERQRLVAHPDFFGGVLGQRAAVGDHGDDPFAGIAGLSDRERMALHLRRIEPVHQRIGRRGEFIAGQHIMHAGHRQRRRRIDRDDARGRMLRRQDRDMQHALERDIGDEMARAGDEAAVLADPAIGRDEAEGSGIGGHFGLLRRVIGFCRLENSRPRRAVGRACTSDRLACVPCRGVLALRKPLGGELDGLDDLAVAGAAADIARDRLDDVLAGRASGVLQQRMRGQDHAGRAIAALQAVGFAERILEHAEFARRRREAFDGRDLVAVGLHREHQAGPHRLAIEQHRAGAADAVLAAGMGADQEQILAHGVEQRLARFDVDVARATVHLQR